VAFANGAGYYTLFGPGSVFFSVEAAGKAGALYYWKSSDNDRREYGGTIYEDRNGVFSFGEGQIGPPCAADSLGGCEMTIRGNIRPKGTILIGDYHTHPDLGQGASDFSKTDVEGLADAHAWGFVTHQTALES